MYQDLFSNQIIWHHDQVKPVVQNKENETTCYVTQTTQSRKIVKT